MCCVFVLVAALGPRITIFLLALFSQAFNRAFDSFIWPLLGFFFMPYTTLAYALAIGYHGSLQGIWMVLFILAVLADFGVIGGAAHQRRRRYDGDGVPQ